MGEEAFGIVGKWIMFWESLGHKKPKLAREDKVNFLTKLSNER
jgi:hypothetical protein